MHTYTTLNSLYVKTCLARKSDSNDMLTPVGNYWHGKRTLEGWEVSGQTSPHPSFLCVIICLLVQTFVFVLHLHSLQLLHFSPPLPRNTLQLVLRLTQLVKAGRILWKLVSFVSVWIHSSLCLTSSSSFICSLFSWWTCSFRDVCPLLTASTFLQLSPSVGVVSCCSFTSSVSARLFFSLCVSSVEPGTHTPLPCRFLRPAPPEPSWI